MLGPMGRPVHQEHCSRRRDRVDHADDGLLRDAPLAGPGQGEDRCADQCGAEAGRVGTDGLERPPDQEGRRSSESGDLGEGDVNEDHLPRDHVDPEVGVDARQN